MNEGAAAGDVVTAKALNERTRTREGKNIFPKSENSNREPGSEDQDQPKLTKEEQIAAGHYASDAMFFSDISITQLEFPQTEVIKTAQKPATRILCITGN